MGWSTRPRPAAERFWEKVRPAGPFECWEWIGALAGGGYGHFAMSRSEVPAGARRGIEAHRWAYECMVGPIPSGMQIDHLCRNRACVNPFHLEAVPQRENLLRGTAPVAINAAKSHCINGHPFDITNTFLKARAGGRISRDCRRCGADRANKYREQRRNSSVQTTEGGLA